MNLHDIRRNLETKHLTAKSNHDHTKLTDQVASFGKVETLSGMSVGWCLNNRTNIHRKVDVNELPALLTSFEKWSKISKDLSTLDVFAPLDFPKLWKLEYAKVHDGRQNYMVTLFCGRGDTVIPAFMFRVESTSSRRWLTLEEATTVAVSMATTGSIPLEELGLQLCDESRLDEYITNEKRLVNGVLDSTS